jgi:uncharacterized glyoxalase superfamily protein PhnB
LFLLVLGKTLTNHSTLQGERTGIELFCCKYDFEVNSPITIMSGMKITHIVCWVQENKLSEKFYSRLGFEVRESDDEHSVVALGGFGLDLVSMRDDNKFAKDSMAAEKGLGMYVYICVEDVDTKYAELLAKGFTGMTKPKDWPWGNREVVLKDPDGYKLCFWQPSNS